MRAVAVCAFLFLIAHACVLRGQSVKASLSGRVTDQSKALITGARLVAIRTSTNVSYETVGVTYDLPLFGSNKSLYAVLGGWSLNSFVFARSAPPVDIVGRSFSAAGVRLDARPNVNTSLPLELFDSQFAGGKIFNLAFSAAPAGQQGSLGHNVLVLAPGKQTSRRSDNFT